MELIIAESSALDVLSTQQASYEIFFFFREVGFLTDMAIQVPKLWKGNFLVGSFLWVNCVREVRLDEPFLLKCADDDEPHDPNNAGQKR